VDIKEINWLGLLTLVLAGFGAYIAWRQWKTAAYRVKLDLFDRRYRIYEEVRKLLKIAYPSGRIELVNIEALQSQTVEAKFLFGDDVQTYLKEIYDHARNLEFLHFEEKTNEKWRSEMTWAGAQLEESGERFKRYLNFNKIVEKSLCILY